MRTEQGTIKAWVEDRGFGFITPDDHRGTAGDVFAHITEVRPRGTVPQKGARVEYERTREPRGWAARQVRLV